MNVGMTLPACKEFISQYSTDTGREQRQRVLQWKQAQGLEGENRRHNLPLGIYKLLFKSSILSLCNSKFRPEPLELVLEKSLRILIAFQKGCNRWKTN